MLKEGERIFCEWDNGSYVNSLLGGDRFLQDFAELVKRYGAPCKVEIRTEKDWIRIVNPDNNTQVIREKE
ncbi:hypothetical protein C4565_00740 [Candidatus Parcubacteria bacterium]|nr:MAG: hypothetical protein C4565_00740 [Candidatus Parcubacteria bacterium]